MILININQHEKFFQSYNKSSLTAICRLCYFMIYLNTKTFIKLKDESKRKRFLNSPDLEADPHCPPVVTDGIVLKWVKWHQLTVRVSLSSLSGAVFTNTDVIIPTISGEGTVFSAITWGFSKYLAWTEINKNWIASIDEMRRCDSVEMTVITLTTTLGRSL